MQCCSALFGGSSVDRASETLMTRLKEALEDVNADCLGVKPEDVPTDPSQVLNACARANYYHYDASRCSAAGS